MCNRRPGPGHSERLGFLLLAGTGLIWGTIGVAAKIVYRETDLDAVSVTWLRAVIASPVCLGLGWLAMGRQLFRSSRRDLALMTGLGAILILYQWLYLAAIDRLGVTTATLVALCVPPVVVALVSTVFWREPFTSRLGAALVGAVVGTVLLVAQPTGAGGLPLSPESTIIGILLALGSAGGVALHVLTSRLIASRQHPLRPLAIGFPAGAIAFTPVALANGVSLAQPAAGWFWLVYLGIVPSAIAYWMYQRGLRDVTATMASIVTLLEPLAAAGLAWVIFDERLGPLALLGGALLVGSIALLSLGPVARLRPADEVIAP